MIYFMVLDRIHHEPGLLILTAQRRIANLVAPQALGKQSINVGWPT
jgi:hypothetical protein